MKRDLDVYLPSEVCIWFDNVNSWIIHCNLMRQRGLP